MTLLSAVERRALAFCGLVVLSGAARLCAQDLYWGELKTACVGSVLRHSVVGSMATDDPIVSMDFVTKVALDSGARKVYWSEGKKVRRANLDSAGVADVVSVTSPASLGSFALDLVNRKIYWIEIASGGSPCNAPNCPRILRADLDGLNPEPLFSVPNGNRNLSDIAVDTVANKVYWSDRQYTPFISRADFNGSNLEPLVMTAIANGGAQSLILDLPGGKMYWVDASGFIPGDSRIRVANLDGSSADDVVSFINSEPRPRFLAIDAACGRLYWTFSAFCPDGTGDIVRINLTTKAQEPLFTGVGLTRGIAVDAGADKDKDGTPDCKDGCPNDANKTAPGTCGCGVSDADTDHDGTPDCNDGCPNDPAKTSAGACGCGVADTDTDKDGTPDCNDGCPNDPAKTAPGACGCGAADTDANGNGTPDCNDTPTTSSARGGLCAPAAGATTLTLAPMLLMMGRRFRRRPSGS